MKWRTATDSSHTCPVTVSTLNLQFTIKDPNRV